MQSKHFLRLCKVWKNQIHPLSKIWCLCICLPQTADFIILNPPLLLWSQAHVVKVSNFDWNAMLIMQIWNVECNFKCKPWCILNCFEESQHFLSFVYLHTLDITPSPVLWICIIFEDKLQSRQLSRQIQNPKLVEFQWSAFNSCLLTFYKNSLRPTTTLASRMPHTVNTELSSLSPPSTVCEFPWYLLVGGRGDGEGKVKLITLIKLPKQNV